MECAISPIHLEALTLLPHKGRHVLKQEAALRWVLCGFSPSCPANLGNTEYGTKVQYI